jgi:hypothetical protein
MPKRRCNACGGEFRDTNGDGSRYFHVCPPETIVRAELDNGTDEDRPLPQWAGITLVETKREKAELVNAGAQPESIAVMKRRRDRRRAHHRDENTSHREGTRGERRILKAEGAGAVDIDDDPVSDEA